MAQATLITFDRSGSPTEDLMGATAMTGNQLPLDGLTVTTPTGSRGEIGVRRAARRGSPGPVSSRSRIIIDPGSS
ncbi:MAG TPA: hypothetical protein PKY70_19625 [Nakamurella multipartita]|nr:hypothetical protein [Nakamurella multipartita]